MDMIGLVATYATMGGEGGEWEWGEGDHRGGEGRDSEGGHKGGEGGGSGMSQGRLGV